MRGKVCHLQVRVLTTYKTESKVCEQELFWKVVDRVADSGMLPPGNTIINYLLEFKSMRDRKRFVKHYTVDGRLLGSNYLIVKCYSTWVEDDKSLIPSARIRELGNETFLTLQPLIEKGE